MRYRFFLVIFFISAHLLAQEKKPAFWNDIQQFRKQDSVSFPGTGKILFTGSSSFTKWKDVQAWFPGYPIINRGFGGSSLTDVIRYSDDVIFKYQPKQIVIYCGENDLAANDTISAETVIRRFTELFSLIRSRDKNVLIAYISMKPSPSRQRLLPKFLAANLAIKNFLEKKRKTAFIDVYYKMLKTDGTPMDDIFLEDKLHMNAKGYAIWQKVIEPYLLK
ncbi:MAG TPA: GDSL-type esterase/lipase family protein [Chitinophagaceae bacterium]